MIGEIGGNEIDAVTVSIISKQKKSFLFSLQNELLWLLIPNSPLLFHRVIGYGDTQVVVTEIFPINQSILQHNTLTILLLMTRYGKSLSTSNRMQKNRKKGTWYDMEI